MREPGYSRGQKLSGESVPPRIFKEGRRPGHIHIYTIYYMPTRMGTYIIPGYIFIITNY